MAQKAGAPNRLVGVMDQCVVGPQTQVPLLLMRQVLVKVVPPATLVLSGMVISVTNEALLVQSGGLVGKGVPTVGVSEPANSVADVAVAEEFSGLYCGCFRCDRWLRDGDKGRSDLRFGGSGFRGSLCRCSSIAGR